MAIYAYMRADRRIYILRHETRSCAAPLERRRGRRMEVPMVRLAVMLISVALSTATLAQADAAPLRDHAQHALQQTNHGYQRIRRVTGGHGRAVPSTGRRNLAEQAQPLRRRRSTCGDAAQRLHGERRQ